MRRIALACAIALSLSACEQGAANQDAAKPAATDPNLSTAPRPGQYRVTTKVTKVEFPGMTGAMSEKARTMFGATAQASEYCLTPQDAGKGREDYYRRTLAKGDCKYERLRLTNNSIDAVLVCQTGQGMTARNEIAGTFTDTRSDLAIKSLSRVPGGEISMAAEVASERIGDCT